MPDLIREASLQWAEAVKSRDPESVLKLYHPDAVLWGTLSPVIRHGLPTIREYFIIFLNRNGLSCTFLESISRTYGEFALLSGTYEFTWKAGKKHVMVPARFSFIYKKENGKWLIMEHHSSLFPELPFKARKYLKP